MSGFSAAQLRKLTGKLDRRHVQSRKMDERDVDYIEGWFAISEANAIFGFGGWDREMTHFERVFERTRGEITTCSYIARVRIRVRAGRACVMREGTGWGTASCRSAADAHERAIKAAETDATKRALATFGNRFGLGLYDKDQTGVTPRHEGARNVFAIVAPDGSVFAARLSAEGFCSGLRRILDGAQDREKIALWLGRNEPEIERLKLLVPALKTAKGEHYADLLVKLFLKRLGESDMGVSVAAAGASETLQPLALDSKVGVTVPNGPDAAELIGTGETTNSDASVVVAENSLAAPAEVYPLARSQIAYGARIDKAELGLKTVRRQRDKDHLRHVATLPCLVCQTSPSHPHHLKFAQSRGLALKVSDEFVVPLCDLHHNDLHRDGAEVLWWKRLGIEPLAIARALWEGRDGSTAATSVAAE